MIEQSLYIANADWDVVLFYDATPKFSGVIMRQLWQFGIPAEKYYEAQRLLNDNKRNEGLTYSNIRSRCSVVVIGRVSSCGQFINTIVHECDHLADHISQYYGIPLDSEENAYLHGDIVQQIVEEAAEDMGGRFKGAWHELLKRY